jgi:hypothetical protein
MRQWKDVSMQSIALLQHSATSQLASSLTTSDTSVHDENGGSQAELRATDRNVLRRPSSLPYAAISAKCQMRFGLHHHNRNNL